MPSFNHLLVLAVLALSASVQSAPVGDAAHTDLSNVCSTYFLSFRVVLTRCLQVNGATQSSVVPAPVDDFDDDEVAGEDLGARDFDDEEDDVELEVRDFEGEDEDDELEARDLDEDEDEDEDLEARDVDDEDEDSTLERRAKKSTKAPKPKATKAPKPKTTKAKTTKVKTTKAPKPTATKAAKTTKAKTTKAKTTKPATTAKATKSAKPTKTKATKPTKTKSAKTSKASKTTKATGTAKPSAVGVERGSVGLLRLMSLVAVPYQEAYEADQEATHVYSRVRLRCAPLRARQRGVHRLARH